MNQSINWSREQKFKPQVWEVVSKIFRKPIWTKLCFRNERWLVGGEPEKQSVTGQLQVGWWNWIAFALNIRKRTQVDDESLNKNGESKFFTTEKDNEL